MYREDSRALIRTLEHFKRLPELKKRYVEEIRKMLGQTLHRAGTSFLTLKPNFNRPITVREMFESIRESVGGRQGCACCLARTHTGLELRINPRVSPCCHWKSCVYTIVVARNPCEDSRDGSSAELGERKDEERKRVVTAQL